MQDTRITFTHGSTTLRVQPANIQRVRDQLAKLEKTRKPKLPKADATAFPSFAPGMSTAEYVHMFQELNSPAKRYDADEYKAKRLEFTYANRAAPMLDPLQPEVFEEPDPDYVAPVKAAKRKPKATGDALDLLREALALMPLGTAIRAEWVRKASAVLAGA